jgi:hypothetical protein
MPVIHRFYLWADIIGFSYPGLFEIDDLMGTLQTGYTLVVVLAVLALLTLLYMVSFLPGFSKEDHWAQLQNEVHHDSGGDGLRIIIGLWTLVSPCVQSTDHHATLEVINEQHPPVPIPPSWLEFYVVDPEKNKIHP